MYLLKGFISSIVFCLAMIELSYATIQFDERSLAFDINALANESFLTSDLTSEGGLTKTEFEKVLKKFEDYYHPVVTSKGLKLKVIREFRDNYRNAVGSKSRNEITIIVGWGLARHPEMTEDGLLQATCFAIGTVLGGAPKVANEPFPFEGTSVIGQADYYTTLRCMRYILGSEDNVAWVNKNHVDSDALKRCQVVYSTEEQKSLCARMLMASLSTARFFAANSTFDPVPRFETPSTRIVKKTDLGFNSRPTVQCRLDTYLQGALCAHDIDQELSDLDPEIGTCHRRFGNEIGARPRCWYAPPSSLQ